MRFSGRISIGGLRLKEGEGKWRVADAPKGQGMSETSSDLGRPGPVERDIEQVMM